MTSYLYRAPAGIPGSVTRVDETNVEPGKLTADTAYGSPVRIGAGGKFDLMGTGAVASDFYGVLTRIAPAISNAPETYAGGAAEADSMQGIAVRGYVNVACVVGTPARGGIVYVRVIAGANPVGSFEATADGANNVALTGVTWASDGKDSSNNAEIRIAR